MFPLAPIQNSLAPPNQDFLLYKKSGKTFQDGEERKDRRKEGRKEKEKKETKGKERKKNKTMDSIYTV